MKAQQLQAQDHQFTKPVRLDKRKKDFLELWLNPNSDTFANAYRSAIAAGFKDSYARSITGNVRNLEWVQQGKELLKNFTPVHVVAGFQKEATQAKDSRDRIQALDRLAKIHGMYIDRSQSDVTVTFNNSVPRPVIDITDTV